MITPEWDVDTLKNYVGLLQTVIVFMLVSFGLLWRLPGEHCHCEKCAFHVNERRVAKMRQSELQHNVQHKGQGYDDDDPDRYDCADIKCSRNKRNVPPGTLNS